MGCAGSKTRENSLNNKPIKKEVIKSLQVPDNKVKEEVKSEQQKKESKILPNIERVEVQLPPEEIKDHLKIENRSLVGENKDVISKSYKVLEKLGEGTFGKVYKVLHLATQQLRAMKLVKKESINYQDDSHEFLKEIQVLANLDHPNVIKVYEYFIDEKFYYVITELAMGGELYDQIYKIQFYNEIDAANIMQQLLSAVFYLHSNNIVHRDLKPENIMLETNVKGDLGIKLIDFGAANVFDKEKASKKLTLKVGTPYYIAPEVIKKNYDHQCDLWSCGVILYILLCGYPPFGGDNDAEIMKNVSKGEFEFDDQDWNKVSKEAKMLISRLLTLDPKKRICAEDALKDPWIVKNMEMKKLNVVDMPKISSDILQRFTSKQKLQQASVAFIVHQMSTNDAVKKLREVFKQIDTSGDGRLTHDELRSGYMKFFSDSLTLNEFKELIKKLDSDNSGYIEYEEFLRATIDTESIFTEKNLKIAFKFFDKDASGKLSPEEIKDVLGIIKSDTEGADLVQNIIAEVDINGDGEINFEEFKNLMKKNSAK